MSLVIFLTVFICFLLVIWSFSNKKSLHKLPPALSGELPLIGHTHILLANTKDFWGLNQRIMKECLKKGGVIHAKFGLDIYYIISDYQDALTVANTCMKKHFSYDFPKKWLGQGLITGSDEVYLRHRKLLSPGFTPHVVHGYLDIFNIQGKKLLDAMDTYVDKGPFDQLPIIKSVILEMACLTTFGFDIKDENLQQKYMIAVDEMLHLIRERLQKPYLQNRFIYKLLGLQRKENDCIKDLNEMSNQVIQQKKAAIKSKTFEKSIEESSFRPYLDLLLELSLEGLLSDKEIREELDTSVVATFDTTSHTLVNALVHLGAYPHVQEKIYEELTKVLGSEKDKNIEKDDLQKFVYTKAVIKETLRMVPTAPVLPRFVDKEVKLKNYTMRANSQCLLMNIGLHRDSAWGPDVEEFKPERWLDPRNAEVCDNYFAGFSIGKRACAGRKYAMTVLIVLLVHLVRRYKWTADIQKLVLNMEVTLKPMAGYEICITRRTT